MSSDGWQSTSFGEIAILRRDPVAAKDIEDDSPYVGLEHIGQGTLSLQGFGRGKDVASGKSRFVAGDVLFGKLRPYFRKVARPAFDGVCSTDIWVIRAREQVDQGFLFYLVAGQDFVDFANSGSSGTRMPRANWRHVEDFRLALPPLEEQRAIAEVLGALDDRIEWAGTLRRIVLELLITVFRHGATEHRRVQDVAEVVPGQSPPGSTYNDAGRGLPFYQGSAQFGPLIPKVEKWCSEPQRVAEAGDILFSVRAPVGDLNVAEEQCCIGRGVAAIRSQYRATVYAALRSATGEWSIHDSSGTVFGSITGRSLREARIPWPPDIDALSPTLEDLLDTAMAAEGEAKVLQAARAALLPKLVSGEIRIEDPKHLLDQAA